MDGSDSQTLVYGEATRSQWPAALELLLLRRSAEAEAVLRSWFTEAPHSEERRPVIFVAHREGRLAAAGAALLQPGRVALCWPPRWSPEEGRNTAVELLRHQLAQLQGAGIVVAQAFPDAPSSDDEDLLTGGGFEHAADMLYLVSTQTPETPPALTVSLESYTPANHARFLAVLDRTYEGTLDCPRLNGVRAPEDVLATYRAAGEFDPRRWLLATQEGRDVGCLLLNDHPADDQWELVYVGLCPEVRGRGIGRQLVQQALWLTRQAGRARLVLAVDSANAPAIGLYASEGFVAYDRRAVFLSILREERKST